jgi:hypothetical protein
VDLLLKEGRKRIAVQCKKYGKPVGNAAVSAIYAGAKHYGAKQAWVVAPEGFTKGAVELAKSTGVRLLGRKGAAEQSSRASSLNAGAENGSGERNIALARCRKTKVASSSTPGNTTWEPP